MNDFASVTQAIVDSTSTALRSVAAGAEKLAPHAASAMAARAIVSFFVPAVMTAALMAAAFYAWRGAAKDNWDDEGLVGVAVVCSILLAVSFVFSFVSLGDAAAAFADPIGYMILTLMGK